MAFLLFEDGGGPSGEHGCRGAASSASAADKRFICCKRHAARSAPTPAEAASTSCLTACQHQQQQHREQVSCRRASLSLALPECCLWHCRQLLSLPWSYRGGIFHSDGRTGGSLLTMVVVQLSRSFVLNALSTW